MSPPVALAPPIPESRRVVVMPDEGVDPILSAIEGSQRRLYLKIFELSKPKLIRAVVAAHQRGVEVRVQLNRIRSDGSFMNGPSNQILRRAGVAVKWCNPRFTVSHEKSLVVDDQAFICSFNFCGRFFKRVRGYAVITTLKSEVDEILACFKSDWTRHERSAADSSLLWGGPETRTRILTMLDSATKTLDIQHKKLADACVLERLLNAVERGARVRFLCSAERGVHGGDLFENAACMRILKKHGVEVNQLQRPKVHAKLIVVDGRQANVGSINLAVDCFEKRRELGIFLDQEIELAPLQATFEADWARSVPWNPPDPQTIEADA